MTESAGDTSEPLREPHASGFAKRIRDWGWKRAIYWQFMPALAKGLKLHVHQVGVGADHPDDFRDPPQQLAGYVNRLGTIEDLLPFVDKVPNLDREFVELAKNHGDQITVTFFGPELVGFGFSTRVRARVTDQLDVVVPKGFVYGYKGWTHEAHRRKNLARLRGQVEKKGAARGKLWAWGASDLVC